MKNRNFAILAVLLVITSSIGVYSADAAGIPKKAISTVARFLESDLPVTTAFTELSQTFTGANTFSHGINSVAHSNTGLIVANPADTQAYTITGAAITANRTLNLPLTTGTDTLGALGMIQTWTGANIFNHGINSIMHSNTGLIVANPADTFSTTLQGGTVAGNITLTLPTSTGTVLSDQNLVGVAGNTTVTSNSGTTTVNLGSNAVTTGGSTQTITKILNLNSGSNIDGLGMSYVSKTGAYTPTATDDIIAGDTSSSSFAITLPSAVTMGSGKIFLIKNIGQSAANVLQILTTSSQTVDGAKNINMTYGGQMLGVFSDGTNWQAFKNLDTSWDGFYVKGSTTKWYGNAMSALAPNTVLSVITTLRASPWIVPHTITIDKIQAEISTAASPTSTTCRIGIYTDNGNAYPDALVAGSDVGTFTTTATVKTNTFGSPITLHEGLHWLSYTCGTAGTTQPTWRALTAGSIPPVLGVTSVMGTNNGGNGYTVAFTFAALPQTFPAGATVLPSNTNVAQILVEIQKG